MHWARAAICVGLLAFAACALGPPTREGELEQGTFEYVCKNRSDSSCNDFGTNVFPSVIAVGASFGLRAKDGSVSTMAPAVTHASGTFRATKPGQYAFLLTRAGKIVDYVHLRFERAKSLESDRSLLKAPVGGSVTAHVTIGERLGGSVTPTIEIVPDDLATASVAGGEVSVRGLRPGAGLARVHALGLELTIPIEISEPYGLPDAGEDAEELPVDAGSETGTDAASDVTMDADEAG